MMAERSGSFVYSDKSATTPAEGKEPDNASRSAGSSASSRKGVEGRVVRGTKGSKQHCYGVL